VSNNDARLRLGELQAGLMRALTGSGEADVVLGLDLDRLQAAARSLASKRTRGVATSWPGLADALGNDFGLMFGEFAAATGLPSMGGPLADGRAFSDWLARQGRLPEAGRLEAFAVDLRFRRQTGGLVPRRGPWFVLGILGPPRRLVLAIRSHSGGEWWGFLPLTYAFGQRSG
jgi:hypothetical protein